MTILKRFSFNEAEAFLNGFTNYEKIGVPVLKRGDRGRMAALLAALGDPQTTRPAIHITGSKGKGTVCLLLEALLTGAGLNVGTYLSPHVECVTERMRAHGAQLTREAFADALARISEPITALPDRPTYFEIMTALAWWVFRHEKVDCAIVEAGIGGLFDATGLLDPVLTMVTSVELEHTNVLGRTEREILEQKCGIARPGVPLILGPLKAHLRAAAEEELRRREVPLIVWNEAVKLTCRNGIGHVRLSDPLPSLEVRFAARDRPFAINAALALAAAAAYLKQSPEDPARILEACPLPGRKELIPGTPPVFLDVAHTYQSLKALEESVARAFGKKPITVVFALAANKNARRMLPVVERFATNVIFVQADAFRGSPAEELLELSRHANSSAAASTEKALEKATSLAGAEGAVCVCGSFVLVGQARAWLREREVAPGSRA